MSPGLLPGAGCGLPAGGARRPVSRVGGGHEWAAKLSSGHSPAAEPAAPGDVRRRAAPRRARRQLSPVRPRAAHRGAPGLLPGVRGGSAAVTRLGGSSRGGPGREPGPIGEPRGGCEPCGPAGDGVGWGGGGGVGRDEMGWDGAGWGGDRDRMG